MNLISLMTPMHRLYVFNYISYLVMRSRKPVSLSTFLERMIAMADFTRGERQSLGFRLKSTSYFLMRGNELRARPA